MSSYKHYYTREVWKDLFKMVRTICIVFLLILAVLNDIDCRRNKFRRRGRGRKGVAMRSLRKSTRIIAGVPAVDGQWPFVVSIQSNGNHMCGGSIIGDKWVLTACHCFSFSNDEVLPEENLSVTVGSIMWKKGTKHKVEKLIMHENYDDDIVVNDIALLKMKRHFVFNNNVKPIKPSPVNVDDEHEEIPATVIGWGFTNDGKKLVAKASERLNYAQLHTIPWHKCRDSYTDIRPTNLCMMSGTMEGSCNGDSGGPLVTYTDQGLVQIGLVSFGDDCNNTKPEVYTRVPLFLNWIKSHTK